MCKVDEKSLKRLLDDVEEVEDDDEEDP